MPVEFHSTSKDFQFNQQEIYQRWIETVIRKEGAKPGDLNLIFTSNAYILELNQKYLNHNYHTDVITFNYNEDNSISGDIFVSVDQVKINADRLGESFEKELARVMIHGVIHLLGYNDDTDDQKRVMTRHEDVSLKVLEDLLDGKAI